MVDLPGYSRRPVAGGTGEEAKKLFVGKEINLSGEIRECETLVVEGTVEAALSDARSIEILESGLFKWLWNGKTSRTLLPKCSASEPWTNCVSIHRVAFAINERPRT